MIDFGRRYGLYLGLTFVGTTAWLLAGLHLFAEPVVPRPRHQANALPALYVCDGDRLSWVTTERIDVARAFWAAHGSHIDPPTPTDCSAWPRCTEGGRQVPCFPGNLVIAATDAPRDPHHPGETVGQSDPDGKVSWATILLPSHLDAAHRDTEWSWDRLALPRDFGALVLTHEIGHWLGYDHVRTRISGCLYAEPFGHVMARSTETIGWNSEGLP